MTLLTKIVAFRLITGYYLNNESTAELKLLNLQNIFLFVLTQNFYTKLLKDITLEWESSFWVGLTTNEPNLNPKIVSSLQLDLCTISVGNHTEN